LSGASVRRVEPLGGGAFAHARRVLLLEGEPGGGQTLVVADAHLGYAWAQRRRGELGPLRDEDTGAGLFQIVDELRPSRIVLLGDAVHAPKPGPEERALIESTLQRLTDKAEIIAVLGNHDRHFQRDFPNAPVAAVPEWATPEWLAVHGDRPLPSGEGRRLLIGHLHPVISFPDAAGAGQRVPCFLVSARAILLPAFSPFAAGFDVGKRLPAEWRSVFEGHPAEVVAATGRRVVRVGPIGNLRFRAG
jgi:uncharacterized protein